MQKLTDQDPETQSADLIAGNIEQLQSLFPEAFTEGKVDFEVLKQLLGGAVDEREEKYGLNWHGKRRARQIALTPSTGTLRPCPEDSVDWDTTQNLMIEGDNLEVLKLLQKSYAGKVKLIYIDPPYNTGNDFVYPDDFRDNIKNYQKITGQVEGGKKISSHTEAGGRFHTDWLNMMYPRLKLARNLLRDDGVIFISIDDNEVSSLRKVCDEVFGDENFVGSFLWKKKGTTTNVEGAKVSSLTEYVICYGKAGQFGINYRTVSKETRDYPFVDSEGKYRKTVIEKKNSGGYERKTMQFEIIGVKPRDGKRWQIGEDTARLLEKKNRFLLEEGVVKLKIYDFEDKDTTSANPNTLFENGSTDSAATDLSSLLGESELFSNPKPKELISKLIDLSTNQTETNTLVLDFFAGSGTTAHAAILQNSTDNGSRRYILVQLPEPLNPANKDQKAAADWCDQLGKPRTIAELTKERLRRAANKLKDENQNFTGDLGFRVFKLDSSNIHAWEPDRDNLAQSLFDAADHLKTDRTEQDILFELLLKLGLDLTVPIEQKNISGKTVHSIGAGVLLTCLAPQISNDEAESLALGIVEWHKQLSPAGETQVVFRDSAFTDDVAKTNLSAILQQNGLENVRSL